MSGSSSIGASAPLPVGSLAIPGVKGNASGAAVASKTGDGSSGGDTTSTVANANGSTTTTVTSASGAVVSVSTTPAASASSGGSAGLLNLTA